MVYQIQQKKSQIRDFYAMILENIQTFLLHATLELFVRILRKARRVTLRKSTSNSYKIAYSVK